MANGFRVQVSKLGSGMNDLQGMNERFNSIMKQLQETTTALAAQWEGDAHTKYTQSMNRDIVAMTQFHTLMSQYIEALSNIASKYSTTEQTNVGIIQ